MYPKILVIAAMGTLAGTLQGCVEADAQRTSITAPQDHRVAGLGDAVLSVHGAERSANKSGRNGVTGGDPLGTTTLYYVGTTGGKAVFIRRDVLVQAGQQAINSAMSKNKRSGGSYFDQRGGAIPYSGVASINAYPIVVPPNLPHHRIVGVRDQKISVSIGNSVEFSGKTLTVVDATTLILTFAIR